MSTYKKVKCYECGKFGHKISSCPKIECFFCKTLGHMSNVCPLIKCYNCNKKGHTGYYCKEVKTEKQLQRERNYKEYTCRKCYFDYGDDYGPCECY